MGLKKKDVQSLVEMGDDLARSEVEKELSCLNEEE